MPTYLLRQPADQRRTTYSVPKNTTRTISCGDRGESSPRGRLCQRSSPATPPGRPAAPGTSGGAPAAAGLRPGLRCPPRQADGPTGGTREACTSSDQGTSGPKGTSAPLGLCACRAPRSTSAARWGTSGLPGPPPCHHTQPPRHQTQLAAFTGAGGRGAGEGVSGRHRHSLKGRGGCGVSCGTGPSGGASWGHGSGKGCVTPRPAVGGL